MVAGPMIIFAAFLAFDLQAGLQDIASSVVEPIVLFTLSFLLIGGLFIALLE